MSEPLIQMSGLSKSFAPSQWALREIETTLPSGKIIGIVGPDGAGKTTLLRLLAGLLLPSAGRITVLGYDTILEAESIQESIGYMPQKFGLYEDLTVAQNLALYADLKGVDKKERNSLFEPLLAFTKLAPFTERLARDLSGGMKQKLGLACAMMKKPRLLILDEPTVGIDPLSRLELWSMVKSLEAEKISILWSTSYLDEAEKCDEVLLLNEGKLAFIGPPQKFTERVEGRVFKITEIARDRRELLAATLQRDDILDSVIQGSDIRLLVKDHHSLETLLESNEQLKPAEPRFEDAFVDLLGGASKEKSDFVGQLFEKKARGEVALKTEQLTKQFGNFTAADRVTFEVKRGEIFGLLGPNGAGKSTTFKMLCGLLKPTSGSATVGGYDLRVAASEARSHIGYMAQKFSLYGHLTASQNLDFFSGIYNLVGARKKEAIDQAIHIFHLEPFLKERSESLPLGVKQRLSLACATMHQPDILFLDEPTSGVDPLMRREFWNQINAFVQKGVTILVTTHFMDEAEYCDRIALIYRSKIVHVATPDALKEIGRTAENGNPTLEDAFIHLIKEVDANG